MNQNSNDRIVTLRDLWNVFRQRFVILMAVAVLVSSCGYLLAWLTYDPMYSSTATMYILRGNESGDYSVGEANTEYALALKVVNDCTYLLKSRSVVNQVITDLNLSTSYEVLAANISTNNPTSTRVLEVTARAATPELAKSVVDTLCDIGEDKIAEAMGYDQVNLYEHGTLAKRPCNSISILLYAIIGAAAAAVVYVCFVVALLLDDRIRSEEDIQRYLGLSILGDIVNVYDDRKSRPGNRYGSKPVANTKKRGS